jgi:restriction endonuclease Mrr
LLEWPLLILGQAKCFDLKASIGRDEIQKFAGQIRECLARYTDNPDPPKNRVPYAYYVQNEPCLPMYITTASFSDRVPGTALANGIRLVDGQELAEFLAYKKIGFVESQNGWSFSEMQFIIWVKKQVEKCTYKKS